MATTRTGGQRLSCSGEDPAASGPSVLPGRRTLRCPCETGSGARPLAGRCWLPPPGEGEINRQRLMRRPPAPHWRSLQLPPAQDAGSSRRRARGAWFEQFLGSAAGVETSLQPSRSPVQGGQRRLLRTYQPGRSAVATDLATDTQPASRRPQSGWPHVRPPMTTA